MNRIVKEHYPASKLPDDLREGLDPKAEVRVTVELASDEVRLEGTAFDRLLRRPERVLSLEEMFAMRRPVYHSLDELNEHIRALRDEWD